ncbi:MAG: type IV secretion system protein, partial [Klebsiella oxytoca]|nr:type IV secretion system protein [Klebsiella oxytoca]
MRTRDHLLALSLFISTQAFSAGIPVFDAVQNTESINQWMQKLQQWEDTVTHYKSELDAYKKQLATATGVRDIQGFLSDARSLKTDIDNLRKSGISLDDLLTT